MVRVGFDVEMDRAAGWGRVLGYVEGAFEFEDGVGARCVGLWLRGGHFVVFGFWGMGMKRFTVDEECKFLDWECGIVCWGRAFIDIFVGCVDVVV